MTGITLHTFLQLIRLEVPGKEDTVKNFRVNNYCRWLTRYSTTGSKRRNEKWEKNRKDLPFLSVQLR